MYFIRTIQQYDQDLMQKQMDIEMAKDELASKYKATVTELDTFIAKSVDTQASLAERCFESKRRDFQRFLQKVSSKHTRSGRKSAAAEDVSLHQFRCFVLQWLHVFSECSIDPISRPLHIVSSEDLDDCKSISEVAKLVEDRLRMTQVKFISSQRDKDKEELSGFRYVWSRLSKTHRAKVAAKRNSLCQRRLALHDQDAESGTLKFGNWDEKVDGPKDAVDRRWLQLGKSNLCCALDKDNADESGYPIVLHWCWCKCVLLSQDHVQLMTAFIVGMMILYIESCVVESSKLALEFEVGVCLICIIFVLYEFVDIDIVQQLERQLKDVQVEQSKLEDKAKAMREFYDNTQRLGDVWLHRTVPRLELLKQFSEELEDSFAGKPVHFLETVNANVVTLESSLPALDLWLADEVMDAKQKRVLGDMMNNLTRARDVKEALALMPQCSATIALEKEQLPLSMSLAGTKLQP